MILKSKTFQDYYGINPDEYYIKFIHHAIDVSLDNEDEYAKIKEDFNTIYNFDTDAFIIYFSDIENYNKILSHIGINNLYNGKIYLRIRSKEKYNKFLECNLRNNIKLIVDINDIEKFDIKEDNLTIQIDKISELQEERLNDFLKNYKIKEVLLGQIPYLSKDDSYLYDVMAKMYNVDSSKKIELEKINKITNDIYTVDEYKEILNKFNNIISQLYIQNQIDGFYKIFDYIARNLSYDDEGVIHTNIDNQNLKGPIFYNKGVCEGYSKYLQQMLSLIDIDSIIVQAGKKKEEDGHVWNQVFIDGNWYNADVTAASYSINHNEQVKTCLVRDDVLLYKTNSSISHTCNENYKDNTREYVK